MKYTAILSAMCLFFLSPVVQAVDFTLDTTNYTDTQSIDFTSQLAISVLTKEGVLTGNPDKTFRPNTTLNRAEFVAIAMRLSGVSLQKATPCFPDVRVDVWYNQAVCTARSLGFIRGNVIGNTPESEWLFAPERSVSFVEALKILYNVYGVSFNEEESSLWYEQYLKASLNDMTHLSYVIAPNVAITRAEMAQLTLRFLAWHDGTLDILDILSSISDLSSSSSLNSSQSSQSSKVSSSNSSASTSTAVTSPPTYDTLDGIQVRSNFLLLGTTSVPIAGIKVFSQSQPLIIDAFTIELTAPVTSISSIKVYDETGLYLGNATRMSATLFRAPVSVKNYSVPQKKDLSFYVRAITKEVKSGGISGERLQVSRIGLETTGGYNNESQTVYLTDIQPVFETSTSEITSIVNGSNANDILIAGTSIRMGAFTFKGKVGNDGLADVAFTDLFVSLNKTSGVTVSNVVIKDSLSGESSPCTVTDNKIECTAISRFIGSFKNLSRTVTFYGDITLASNDEYLQLSLNDPGTPSTSGAVHWTDGYSAHTWVYGDSPLVNSTNFKR